MYICPKCENRVKLKYTELYSWHSKEPQKTKRKVKYHKCKRTFWVKYKNKKHFIRK